MELQVFPQHEEFFWFVIKVEINLAQSCFRADALEIMGKFFLIVCFVLLPFSQCNTTRCFHLFTLCRVCEVSATISSRFEVYLLISLSSI